MRWRNSRRSTNVRDRRGMGLGGRAGLGGVATLVVALAVWMLGGDPMQALRVLGGGGSGPAATTSDRPPPADDEAAQFLSAVLAMTEDVWGQIFASEGETYRQPDMVLFSGAVQSACGYGTAASGPFYCPPDASLYLDTDFFGELARMGGSGDFARAYVVGHEVGHHVQNLTGTLERARALQERAGSRAEANELQVLVELQADCYAGVWAHHANRERQMLEPGDVEEGLAATAAIGDDTMARNAGRSVTPESFTHGTSEQRRRWLRTGLEQGDPSACDTFSAGGVSP
ncbi:MAG TPA: neutral zinc metallopeptidase [Longimicrobiales bacterium]|nr:neutral zinc metallopeptidase [Longimicrobiales bacterium]